MTDYQDTSPDDLVFGQPTVERPVGWDRQVETREDRYDWERARLPITAFGETKSLAQWAKDQRCQVSREALRSRIALGWETERAVTAVKHDQTLAPVTYNGRTLTLRGWADLTGIRYGTLRRRIVDGMKFGEAVAAGSHQKAPVVPITAWGETKAVSRWAVDERANVGVTAINARMAAGWTAEQAISEPPAVDTSKGGMSYTACGRTMSASAWARTSGHPETQLRYRLDAGTTMEVALQSLGWLPPWEADPHQILRVNAADLLPGDLVVALSAPSHVTVRRLHATNGDPANASARAHAARSRNALPGTTAVVPVTRADSSQQNPAAPRSARPKPGPPPPRPR